MTEYYLQTTADSQVFDKVDDYTFQHRDEVMLISQGKPPSRRYTGFGIKQLGEPGDDLFEFVYAKDRITTDTKRGNLQFLISREELSVIARFLAIRPMEGVKSGGGFVHEPETVTLHTRRPTPLFDQGMIFIRSIGRDNECVKTFSICVFFWLL